MPKVKTHSGAKKRFKQTGTGKIKRKHAFMRHNTGKHNRKHNRLLGHFTLVDPADAPRIRQLLNS